MGRFASKARRANFAILLASWAERAWQETSRRMLSSSKEPGSPLSVLCVGSVEMRRKTMNGRWGFCGAVEAYTRSPVIASKGS